MEEIKKVTFLDHILNGIGYMLPCVVAGGIVPPYVTALSTTIFSNTQVFPYIKRY